MAKTAEVSFDKLKRECKTDIFNFENTSQVDFGLKIRKKGYNLYMSGVTGTGKTSYAISKLKEAAETEPVPDDWCYIYNFEKPNQPIALNLPAGKGRAFKKDMDDFSKKIKQEIAKAFENKDYEKEKSEIEKDFEVKRDELLNQLKEVAEKHGFKIKTTNAGIFFIPVVDGKTVNEEEFSQLEESVREEITEKSAIIQQETVEVTRKIKNIEKEVDEKVSEWERKVALFAIGVHIKDLKEKYEDIPRIVDYLERVLKDILDNLDEFIEVEEGEEQQLLLPWLMRMEQSTIHKYKINVIVDNGHLKGAPVIVDFNPTYYNLLGKLEYENEMGTVITDFTMIKGGLLHQANGGYIILQVKDVLNNINSWEALKRALRTHEINIENIKEQLGLVSMSALKPEPIPLEIKVILVGGEYVYQLLYEYDEEFRKLFKIRVDFDDEMDRTPENIYKLVQFISSFCNREETLHFHKTGVAKVVEYSSRLVENQEKLSNRFNDIVEMLYESCTWAEIDGADFVRDVHVEKAIEEKINRSDKYDQKLKELQENGTIMIDTEGGVVGQINGLAVLDAGDYMFGKPSRITATAFMGEAGIVNIEREIEMSGTSHSKGVLILNGYIGQKYAQDMPLSLSANLCFEQLYGGIDGDSASSAELYALISSLSGLEINQGIAVTGSVSKG